MNKIAAAVVLVTLTAAAPTATALAAKPRVAPASMVCQAKLATGDLSVFGSPSTAGRNRLGDLIVPNSGQIFVSMVAGAFVDGIPDNSRAVYAVVPSAGLRYFDQWFGEERALIGSAWISSSALRPKAEFLSCEKRLPVYVPADQG